MLLPSTAASVHCTGRLAKTVAGADNPALVPCKAMVQGVCRAPRGPFGQTRGAAGSPAHAELFSGCQVCADFARSNYGARYTFCPGNTRDQHWERCEKKRLRPLTVCVCFPRGFFQHAPRKCTDGEAQVSLRMGCVAGGGRGEAGFTVPLLFQEGFFWLRRPLWLRDMYRPLNATRKTDMARKLHDKESSDEDEIFNKDAG